MFRPRTGLVLLLVLAAAAPARAEDFRDLFNGKDLDGWVVDGPKKDRQGHPIWSVRDGRIVGLGKAYGFLRYDREQFGDFVLRVEYRFPEPGTARQQNNSGLGIRTGRFDPKRTRQTRPSYAAYEVQLLDDAGRPPSVHGTGSLYRYLAPTANPVRPSPEWNVVEVECVGPRIRVTVNGRQVLDADQNAIPDLKNKPAGAPAPKEKPLRGYVCVQSHTGKVEFRKVQVREIRTGDR
jgi:hypothetical protein